jgi:hypothetical protein
MEKSKKQESDMVPQKSTLGERMNDISEIIVERDGKRISLETGEEVADQKPEATDTEVDKKDSYGEFYRPSDK